MSIAIDVLIADTTLKMVNKVKDAIYIVRRPSVSEKEDHHNGNIDRLSMYNATDKFVIVGVVFKSFDSSGRAAVVDN
jgi:hypothetical protein